MTIADALRLILNKIEPALKDPKWDELLEQLETIVEMLEDGASGEDNMEY